MQKSSGHGETALVMIRSDVTWSRSSWLHGTPHICILRLLHFREAPVLDTLAQPAAEEGNTLYYVEGAVKTDKYCNTKRSIGGLGMSNMGWALDFICGNCLCRLAAGCRLLSEEMMQVLTLCQCDTKLGAIVAFFPVYKYSDQQSCAVLGFHLGLGAASWPQRVSLPWLLPWPECCCLATAPGKDDYRRTAQRKLVQLPRFSEPGSSWAWTAGTLPPLCNVTCECVQILHI